MKTVGIIGGVGPEATSEFYLELISQCQNLNNIKRPLILMYSIPLPYNVEEDAVARGIGEERYLPLLIEAAKKLELAGARFLVMPCNTLHVFIEDIRKSVNIPVLSIVEETTKFLITKKISEIGFLSTEITIKKKIYEEYFLKNNIKQILPDSQQQKKLGEIIYRLVMNERNNEDKKEFIEIINTFKEKGVKNILLACTDLQLLLASQNLGIKTYDTMKIFADTTVREILMD